MSIGPCVNTPPVHGVVVFEPTVFQAKYPEFAGINAGLLQDDFNLATLHLNNSCQSRVRDANVRQTLLGLLTAHIAILLQGTNTGGMNPIITPPLGVIGRVSNASEGSVSVAAQLDGSGNPSQAWYTQTKYGFMYWQATAKWRQAVYVRPPCQGGFGNGFGPGYFGPGR